MRFVFASKELVWSDVGPEFAACVDVPRRAAAARAIKKGWEKKRMKNGN